MLQPNSLNIATDLQSQLIKEGYLKLFIFPAEVLNALYDVIMKEMSVEKISFYNSGQESDIERKKYFQQQVLSALNLLIEERFPGYCISRIAIILKGIGSDSACDLHTDDNSFDEAGSFPINIWTPLLPTNEQNGLEIIPQSHQYASKVRGFGIPQYFSELKDALIKKSVAMTTVIGESIVYHPALLHYSRANQTNEVRPAIAIGLAPKGKPQLVYWGVKELLGLTVYTMQMPLADYINWDEKSLIKKRIFESKKFRNYKIDKDSYQHFLAQ